MKAPTTYNERSWAIDLIGHIKLLAGQNNLPIRDAGGEQTVKAEGGSLFPDVLLFGDRATARILQGWELKMPDTDIHDQDFKENAEQKALALGLNSFLLWNVSHAHLYVRDADADTFSRAMEWNDLADIQSRANVVPNRARWEKMAGDIVGVLNDLFARGSLEGRQFVDTYRSGGITALIMENSGLVAEALREAARKNAALRNEMILWWDKYQEEYGGGTRNDVLARAVISNWIGKLLFANILREKDQRAQAIATIDDDTTPQQALMIFRRLSDNCNFWTIFSDSVGLSTIPIQPWNQLKQFNRLLGDLRVGSIDQAQLSTILESTVEVATRKLRGQYPTPIELARLLVHLCVQNIVDDRVLDPCCGSGTIARAALEQKLKAGGDAAAISATVFAGDQDPQAIQIATFALAKPDLMNVPLRLFQLDAFTLEPTTRIDFRNPTTGEVFTEELGQFEVITSNLPFVAQAGRKQYRNAIKRVNDAISHDGIDFSGRADVAAYLPFSLHPLLADGGRLGIIITNAWLSTTWGDDFFNMLDRYYILRSIITSGAGRWFKNSEVVTNILILDKKTDPAVPAHPIHFVVLTRPLEELADDDAVQIAAAQIGLGQTQNDTLTIRSVSPTNMVRFRTYGLGGNAQFVNCDWILALPLVPLKELFDVRRGERRGMNAMFYPPVGHGIEPEYIRPLAKSPSDFDTLQAAPAKQAFCCSRSEAELRALGHTGALNWITKFKNAATIAKLRRANAHWYEMSGDQLSELVMFINYGQRLFVGRLLPPGFADQRLVALEPKQGTDIDLCHALLNSTIAMFIIEGMGFGRGLGALDISKDRIKDFLHMLDPAQLNQEQSTAIKAAFAPLLQRKIFCVADELEQADRQYFDQAIIDAFNLPITRDQVYDALSALVGIRLTATD